MKLTKDTLKQIIAEELSAMALEGNQAAAPALSVGSDVAVKLGKTRGALSGVRIGLLSAANMIERIKMTGNDIDRNRLIDELHQSLNKTISEVESTLEKYKP